MARRWYIIAGSLAFLIGALVWVPARVAYHWFAPDEVALSGISGTIWTGRADHADIAGVYLRDLNWRLQPIALLTGRAVVDVEAHPVSGFFEGQLSASIGGELAVRDASGSIALSALAGLLNMPQLNGTANLRLERLEIVDGLPVAAAGTLDVANLLAPMVYSRASIGGYRIDFFTQGDGIAASIEDTDGVVDIAGSLVLGADRSYEFVGKLAAKPETADALKNQMRFLGTPDSDGKYDFQIQGEL